MTTAVVRASILVTGLPTPVWEAAAVALHTQTMSRAVVWACVIPTVVVNPPFVAVASSIMAMAMSRTFVWACGFLAAVHPRVALVALAPQE